MLKLASVGKVAKAVVSAATAGFSVLATVVADGNLTTGDVVSVALAVVAALGITYVVPNSSGE